MQNIHINNNHMTEQITIKNVPERRLEDLQAVQHSNPCNFLSPPRHSANFQLNGASSVTFAQLRCDTNSYVCLELKNARNMF